MPDSELLQSESAIASVHSATRLTDPSIMANRVYCTYFDHNYLRRVALHHSLQRHAPGSRLWVLCLSEACYRTLVALDLPNLVARRLADFEAADPEVAATRPHRSTIEYYFTCSAAWMLFVLEREPKAEWVTYLDGDLFFYESPEIIYDELQSASVAIIPHRYTSRLQELRKFGTYNVGWVGARNDSEGIAVIEWWRRSCIEWCHDYVDGDRFADQGYLDAFSSQSLNQDTFHIDTDMIRSIKDVGSPIAIGQVGIEPSRGEDWKAYDLMISQLPKVVQSFRKLGVRAEAIIWHSSRLFSTPYPKHPRRISTYRSSGPSRSTTNSGSRCWRPSLNVTISNCGGTGRSRFPPCRRFTAASRARSGARTCIRCCGGRASRSIRISIWPATKPAI
jgi:hypothetical protein